jgi:oligoribonuclease
MNQGKQPEQNTANLVWIDLEMTGLDVDRQSIIQAAVIITDSDLNELDELACDIWQPERAFENMSPYVKDMHEKTGLLKRLKKSLVDQDEAEQRLLQVVARWCPARATLCGNSIWQDRKFIDRYMPGLGRYLGYRMIDVSSLKVLAGRWYDEGSVFKKPTAGAHDALVDIRNSINELKHYRKTLFVEPVQQ